MPLADLEALAQSFVDRANADADAAFNEQHDLARREHDAVRKIEAAGRERWRRDQLARAAAAAVNGGDSADGAASAASADRFAPLDDEPDDTFVARAPGANATPTRPARRPAAAESDADDDEEAQQSWLR